MCERPTFVNIAKLSEEYDELFNAGDRLPDPKGDDIIKGQILALVEARRITRETLRRAMKLTDGEILQLEQTVDVYFETFSAYIEAMNANISFTVGFHWGPQYYLNAFKDIDAIEPERYTTDDATDNMETTA